MRSVIYSVAMSLDGYIAGPEGQFDWIIQDSTIDFGAFFARFDTILMGRRTFEIARRTPGGLPPGLNSFVFSRTMDPQEHPDQTIVADDPAAAVESLRQQPGKEIWLMGGGELFGVLLNAGQVDAIEVAVIPTLLGGGITLLSSSDRPISLELQGTKRFPTGIVLLSYAVRSEIVEPGASRKAGDPGPSS